MFAVQRPWSRTGIALFLALSVWGATDASAGTACPPETDENLPISEKYVFFDHPYATPIYVEAFGDLYRIPLGYLRSQGGREPGQVYKQKGIDFAFWMPTKRFVERSVITTPNYRPCEAGRPRPTKEDFVVKAFYEAIGRNADDQLSTPARKFANRMRHWRYDFREEHGLLRFWLEAYDVDKEESASYRHLDGTQPQIMMTCATALSKLSNPGCGADVYFAERNLYFRLWFAADAVGEWRGAAEAAVELLDIWREDARQNPPPAEYYQE